MEYNARYKKNNIYTLLSSNLLSIDNASGSRGASYVSAAGARHRAIKGWERSKAVPIGGLREYVVEPLHTESERTEERRRQGRARVVAAAVAPVTVYVCKPLNILEIKNNTFTTQKDPRKYL